MSRGHLADESVPVYIDKKITSPTDEMGGLYRHCQYWYPPFLPGVYHAGGAGPSDGLCQPCGEKSGWPAAADNKRQHIAPLLIGHFGQQLLLFLTLKTYPRSEPGLKKKKKFVSQTRNLTEGCFVRTKRLTSNHIQTILTRPFTQLSRRSCIQ